MSGRIYLMCDYEANPVWQEEGDIGIDLDELPLSERTKSALRRWADSYEALPDSEDSDALDAFEREGQRLWRVIREELGPDWGVGYFSEAEERKLWDPAELNNP